MSKPNLQIVNSNEQPLASVQLHDGYTIPGITAGQSQLSKQQTPKLSLSLVDNGFAFVKIVHADGLKAYIPVTNVKYIVFA
jgi:hypothetical protein